MGISSIGYCDEVKLMLPEVENGNHRSDHEFLIMKKFDGKQTYVATKLSNFVKPFRRAGYRVEQIELWVEGIAESDGVTKLFVSFDGWGGCKVILKPRP